MSIGIEYTYRDWHTNTNRNRDSFQYGYWNADQYTNSDSNKFSNVYANRDWNTVQYSKSNTNADWNSIQYGYTNTHAKYDQNTNINKYYNKYSHCFCYKYINSYKHCHYNGYCDC